MRIPFANRTADVDLPVVQGQPNVTVKTIILLGNRFSDNFDLTTSQILVGYNASVKIPPVFPSLLGIICHQLWVAHNRFQFDNTYGCPRTA